jgi:hypothetical protein
MVLYRMNSPSEGRPRNEVSRLARLRAAAFFIVLVPMVALAQTESVEPKVIVVPYPGVADAGAESVPPPVPPLVETAPPPPLETRTIEVTPPMPQPSEPSLVPSNEVMGAPVEQPGAFIDGKPREGAFLSGPGSMTFVLHHTLMTGLGVLATQMIPRAVEAYCMGQAPCMPKPKVFTDQDARVAYLAGSLIGAAVGFGASAWWQFNHWISHRSANFGIISSFIGGAFLGAITDLAASTAPAVDKARAVTWTILIGSLAGAWLSTIVGGGDIALNKATLVVSGAAWAMIYTALIIGMVAASGSGGTNPRTIVDAILITPAIGAAAMGFATLKFNPSTTQIMRANLFGIGVGAAVFLLSGLVLNLDWGRTPTGIVPYILGAVGAIGAKTVVSILWVEAAENPNQPGVSPNAPQNFALPANARNSNKVSPWW